MRKVSYVIVRLVHRYFTDNISRSAAELAYFLLFSIFPMLMVVHAGLSFMHTPSLAQMDEILPEPVAQMIDEYLMHLQATPQVGLMVTGLVLTLYFLSRAVRSLALSINEIDQKIETRSIIIRTMVSLVMTFATILLLLGSLAMVLSSERIFGWIVGMLPYSTALLRFMDIVIAVTAAVLFMLLCYRWLPAGQQSWAASLPGAVLAVVVWVAGTWAFSFYVDNLSNYDVIYGSISTIIVLMLWLYFTAITILLGAVLNHIIIMELPSAPEKKPIQQWIRGL